MLRIKDDFVEKLAKAIPLEDRVVLDVGCGEGIRSVEIARKCGHLTGIDPSEEAVAKANKLGLLSTGGVRNAFFTQGRAEVSMWRPQLFDVVTFCLSFHHVHQELMGRVIDEALYVLQPGGYVVFLEPGTEGTLFEAELEFDAFDGDEREVKKAAYKAMMSHPGLILHQEFLDETIFRFCSARDFGKTAQPKKNHGYIEPFLRKNEFRLNAVRRINIFRAK
jgi:ubiquinone/menaquinone biosynthesis C-methylase UbiE